MGKILITGAGGWLGKELLEFLVLTAGREYVEENISCLTSDGRRIQISQGASIASSPFWDYKPRETIDGIFPLAFPTMEKVAQNSRKNYSELARSSIIRHERLIREASPNWVSLVSSGAVYERDSRGKVLLSNVSSNPYGYFKLTEEKVLSDAASECGANIVVGRLWGAIGNYINRDKKYAVVDFFRQAIASGKIAIRANNRVFRRYVDARSFMQLMLALAEGRRNLTFDSGGEKIELSELARKILKETDVEFGEIIRPPYLGEGNDQYYSESNLFEDLLAGNRIESRSLSALLADLHFALRKEKADGPSSHR